MTLLQTLQQQNQNCGNCRFRPAHDCQRRSPIVTVENHEVHGRIVESVWPYVSEEDWCGEWVIKHVDKIDIKA